MKKPILQMAIIRNGLPTYATKVIFAMLNIRFEELVESYSRSKKRSKKNDPITARKNKKLLSTT